MRVCQQLKFCGKFSSCRVALNSRPHAPIFLLVLPQAVSVKEISGDFHLRETPPIYGSVPPSCQSAKLTVPSLPFSVLGFS